MEEIEIQLLQEKEEQEIELMEETREEQEISLENEPSLYGINSINDYEELDNKPQINNVELSGNKTLEELGIKQEYTANDIKFADGDTFQDKYNSGELKGEKGDTGKQGIQGIQGEKGQDGYTPVKGVDYFDGKDGTNGKDGSNGINGVSCTHSWNGTTLTITSASGTTSANLKGETGAAGKDGANGTNGTNGKDGVNGKDGYTPIKGTDYYTESDKQEMVSLVLAALPSSEEVSY